MVRIHRLLHAFIAVTFYYCICIFAVAIPRLLILNFTVSKWQWCPCIVICLLVRWNKIKFKRVINSIAGRLQLRHELTRLKHKDQTQDMRPRQILKNLSLKTTTRVFRIIFFLSMSLYHSCNRDHSQEIYTQANQMLLMQPWLVLRPMYKYPKTITGTSAAIWTAMYLTSLALSKNNH